MLNYECGNKFQSIYWFSPVCIPMTLSVSLSISATPYLCIALFPSLPHSLSFALTLSHAHSLSLSLTPIISTCVYLCPSHFIRRVSLYSPSFNISRTSCRVLAIISAPWSAVQLPEVPLSSWLNIYGHRGPLQNDLALLVGILVYDGKKLSWRRNVSKWIKFSWHGIRFLQSLRMARSGLCS